MNITSGREGTQGWPRRTISKPKKLKVFRSGAAEDKSIKRILIRNTREGSNQGKSQNIKWNKQALGLV